MSDARQIDRNVAAKLGAETVAIIRAGGYTAPSGRHVDVRAALDACVAGTVEYLPDQHVDQPSAPRVARTVITVENDTVLEVGRRLGQEGPVAALNFASATSPGGGFLSGARAQEEAIARSSGLFAALERRAMYDDPRHQRDARYSDYVLFSPDVPVFRRDSGELLEEPWPLSIVTCAAVNANGLRRYAPDRLSEVETVMTARTARMLSVAANHGVRRFILGAWGCGAFGLEPAMMARVFDKALRGAFRNVFSEIVFAITDWSSERRFIGPFERQFGARLKSLRIPLTVTRCPPSTRSDRVRYEYRGQQLIPEMIVLRRWKERSNTDSAKARGERFEGVRLPPGTWTLLRRWLDEGLALPDITNASVLAIHAERSRALGLPLRAPTPDKFAAMLAFLQRKGVLRDVMERERQSATPGLPDLFLYRVDRNGVHDGRFVEVKKWDKNANRKEPVSKAQKDEIAFLKKLGLSAGVVYVYEYCKPR